MVNCFEQHATCAAGGIVNGLAFLGIEDIDHQSHNGARRIKLAGFFIGRVGELLDQVFVGLAKDVSLRTALPRLMREKCSIRSRSSESGRRSLFDHAASPKMP